MFVCNSRGLDWAAFHDNGDEQQLRARCVRQLLPRACQELGIEDLLVRGVGIHQNYHVPGCGNKEPASCLTERVHGGERRRSSAVGLRVSSAWWGPRAKAVVRGLGVPPARRMLGAREWRGPDQ